MEPTFTTRWFYANLAGGQIQTGPFTCAVCGLPTVYTAHTPNTVLRPTFTDHDALRVPGSGVVCEACAWYFGRQDVRRQSWWLTETSAEPVERAAMWPLLRAHLSTPPDQDGYYLFTIMKRKHLALRAPLNLAGARTRRVRFEVNTVTLDATSVAVYKAVAQLRRYHTWQEIQDDAYRTHALAKWEEPGAFASARDVVHPVLSTALFALIRFVYHREE